MEEEKTESDEVVSDQSSEQEKVKDEEEAKTEAEPEITLQQVAQLAKATQKGYTHQAQQLAQVRETLTEIADKINAKSGAEQGDDEYVTVSKLRQVLAEQQQQAQAQKDQANRYIENAISELSAQGIIDGKDDADSLMKFAIKIKEPDLLKASVAWQEIKSAKEAGKKEAIKKEVQKIEGSKIGTSSKSSTSKEQGVDYAEIKKLDWYNF